MDEAVAVDLAATGLVGTKIVAVALEVVEDSAALPSVAAQQPLQTMKRNGIKLKRLLLFY